MKKENIYQSSNTQTTSDNQYLQVPPNPYCYNGSDVLSYNDSRQSLHAGLTDNNIQNIQTCIGEIGSMIGLEPNRYNDENIFATCGSSMNEKTIKFWDIHTMKLLFEVSKQGFGQILQMTYCKISNTFGTITFDRKISIYKFNPQKKQMKFKFSLRLNNSPSHIEIYKNHLFVGSSKKKQILWMNLKKRKVLRTFQLTEESVKFSFVPRLKCLATNNEGCSLSQLWDGSINHIYFTLQNSRKSPFRRYFTQNSQGLRSTSDMIPSYMTSSQQLPSTNSIESPIKNEQQIDKVKLVNPFLQRNGIGIEGENQLCKRIQYNSQLNCIVFAFFDYILLYDVVNQKIYQVIKDLMPIENVQYQFLNDLLVVQCSERENNQQSYYLFFSRDYNQENNSPVNQQIQFSRLSCQLYQKSKSFQIFDQFLIMDSVEQEMRGYVIRRRIALQNRCSILSSIGQSGYLNTSQQIFRNSSNQNYTFIINDQNQMTNKEKIMDYPEEQENDLNTPFEEKKEKLCSCTIF